MMWDRLLHVPDAVVLETVDRHVRKAFSSVLGQPLRWEPDPGRRPEIAVPLCANDKFTWRKIFDHDPRFTTLSDKLACKRWVSDRVPDLPQARLLWEGIAADDLPAELLAGNVVVKTNHGCADLVIVRDGKPERGEIIEQVKKFTARSHGQKTLQWGYFDVPRRIFVEELLAGGAPLHELKFYMFGARLEQLVHLHDRFGDFTANGREPDKNGVLQKLEGFKGVAGKELKLPLPECYPAAEKVARLLGAEFDHMRVDILSDGPNMWFGELTVYNRAGRMDNGGHDPQAQFTLAWDLRRSWFLSAPQPGWRGIYAAALRRRLDRMANRRPPLPPA